MNRISFAPYLSKCRFYTDDARASRISTGPSDTSPAHQSSRSAPVEWRCAHPSFLAKGDENHEGNDEINRVLDDDRDDRVGDVQRRHCRACAPAGDEQRHATARLPGVFSDDPRPLEAAWLGGARDSWIPASQGMGLRRHLL